MFLHLSVILPRGGVCLSACWDTHPTGRHPYWADTPQSDTLRADTPLSPTPDGYCSRQYTSYWNAFLLLPTNKVCKGYVFTSVCLSIGEGVSGPGGVTAQGRVWSQGVPAPGGLWSKGGLVGGVPAAAYCCGQYISYWNAF